MKLYSIIKLSTGEEIYAKIAEDVNEGSPVLVLEDPMQQEEFYNEDGSTTSVLNKYCYASHENKIPIIKTHVVALTAMSLPFKQYYKAAVLMAEHTSEAYDDKLNRLADRMYSHLHCIANHEPLSIVLVDTDTIH